MPRKSSEGLKVWVHAEVIGPLHYAWSKFQRTADHEALTASLEAISGTVVRKVLDSYRNGREKRPIGTDGAYLLYSRKEQPWK